MENKHAKDIRHFRQELGVCSHTSYGQHLLHRKKM